MAITDIRNPWRDALVPAYFRTALFHVASHSKENGRRIVLHEFPKKELPYAEDMGKRAIEFTVHAYCIAFPRDTGIALYQRDYRIPRDLLIAELEKEGAGFLQMPDLPAVSVVCPRYRVTHQEKFGGYCEFDMVFVEAGKKPFAPTINSTADLQAKGNALMDQIQQGLSSSLGAHSRGQ
jgi:prophage DNA circulation protein